MVEGSITQHYECRQQPPDVHKLKRLLSECPWTGEEDAEQTLDHPPLGLEVSDSMWDTQRDNSLGDLVGTPMSRSSSRGSGAPPAKRRRPEPYTRDALRRRVQCSDVEFDAALAALHPIKTDQGHVMLPVSTPAASLGLGPSPAPAPPGLGVGPRGKVRRPVGKELPVSVETPMFEVGGGPQSDPNRQPTDPNQRPTDSQGTQPTSLDPTGGHWK